MSEKGRDRSEAKTFRKAWDTHKWEWAAALLISILAAVIVVIILDAVVAKPSQRHAYVIARDGQPLRWGYVSNTVGPKVPLDGDGRFAVRDEWRSGSSLMIFTSDGTFCGVATLTETPGGEYLTIFLVSIPQAPQFQQARGL